MLHNIDLSKLSACIETDALWQWHQEIAKFGGADDVAKNGVSRLALSAEEIDTKIALIDWCKARGYQLYSDAMANLYVQRTGRLDVPPVATGSHIDSQIAGGRFDGMYGVLAGLSCLDVLDRLGIETEKPIVVVAWTNEEGSRFAPGAMGSRFYSGQNTVADFAGSRDQQGVALAEALTKNMEILAHHTEILQSPPRFDCYVEAHIEQGPVLEDTGTSVGTVTSIQGTHWFEVTVKGESAHAGTTPLAKRQDAVLAAMDVMTRIRAATNDPDDIVRLTFGRVEVTPNTPNTVANQVFFTIDLRHPDEKDLTGYSQEIERICNGYEGSCTVDITKVMEQPPCTFPTELVDTVESSANALSISNMRLPSGAFHDALFVADVCPACMIFVPCSKGISHNPAEYSEPEHLANGTRVLAASLLKLAGIAP